MIEVAALTTQQDQIQSMVDTFMRREDGSSCILTGEEFEDMDDWSRKLIRLLVHINFNPRCSDSDPTRGYKVAYHMVVVAATYCCVMRAQVYAWRIVSRIFEGEAADTSKLMSHETLWEKFTSELAQLLGPKDKPVYWLHRLLHLPWVMALGIQNLVLMICAELQALMRAQAQEVTLQMNRQLMNQAEATDSEEDKFRPDLTESSSDEESDSGGRGPPEDPHNPLGNSSRRPNRHQRAPLHREPSNAKPSPQEGIGPAHNKPSSSPSWNLNPIFIPFPQIFKTFV